MSRTVLRDHPLLLGIENVEPYALADSGDLYGIQVPPMLIASFLPAGGLMGITSYPGVGKTWLALEVCRAVASGQPFLGKFLTQQGGVLFVGSDSSIYDYARQWRRLTRHLELAYDPGEANYPLFHAVRFLLQSSFMFEDLDEVRRLIATANSFEWGEEELHGEGTADAEVGRHRGFDVIVFDTVSRLTRANQNDNTEMEAVFRNIRCISEFTGAAVVLLHHNSKKSEFNDGSDWRGAMSQIGALDSWVQLVAHRRDPALVGVQFKKFRGITPEDFAFRLDVREAQVARVFATDEPVTMQQRLAGDELAEAIHDHVLKHPRCTAPQIRTALWDDVFSARDDWSDPVKFRNAINNRLKTMTDRGKLVKFIDKGRPAYEPPSE